ncbi:conserved exported protein of unknown function [uncultured Sphingopyxis sp.]|uniref:Uncharacterized protein n=1 Tax=uncultured Sphingopyxis sp. TaxID=310581 RepID=A0A1Y5PZ27_9SPHN|nr:hypothetical protein [uncultured Sphingopyxis sp.]SBV32474.1 conserved exported protein of unknown function [uncultured Sphingopyxis sp.]
MRGWILAIAAIAGSVPGVAAAEAIELPIVPGFWTNDTEKCASVHHGYVFDGTRWGALYYYGPGGTMGPAAELQPITQTRTVEDGFTQMQFGGYDGAGYFRVKPLGTDRALYRVGAPFREQIQVMDEPLIRCDFKALSPKMQAALRRHAPNLAVR